MGMDPFDFDFGDDSLTIVDYLDVRNEGRPWWGEQAHLPSVELPPRRLVIVPEPVDPPLVWRDLASCLGVDGDLFFPARGEPTDEAKAICAGCIVREDCLEYALTTKQYHGIWGGTSERERKRLRKARK